MYMNQTLSVSEVKLPAAAFHREPDHCNVDSGEVSYFLMFPYIIKLPAYSKQAPWRKI